MERSEFEARLAQENARLRESEQFHRVLGELTSDFACAVRFEADGTIILESVTDGFRRVTGYTLDELNAQGGWQSLIYPEDMPAIARAVERLARGETDKNEIRFRARNGELRWVRFLGHPVWDENHTRVVRMYAALQDITALKEGQSVLRESEQRFRQLADSIPHLTWMAQADGAIVWYNRRWYEYTGTTPEQMRGWGWQSVHDPAELPRVLAYWKAALASGQPWEDTFPLRRQDGAMRWHLSRALPVRDDQGRIVQWFGTNTDITERLQMEAALKEADRRKDEFLAMLAHELRNPLASIRNSVHVLKLLGGADPNLQRCRDTIERQVAHLTRLVDDLLEVSRITQGKIGLHREVLDLAVVVGRAVETARSLINARGHQLTVTLPPEPVLVEGDPTRLTQVLANLLHNAAKYTGEAGHIAITVDRQDGEAVMRVRDNGIGILPELLPRVFDLFTQGNRALARSEGGLGIGLTLVRNLVAMHHGRVEAHSEGPGKGSEFVVYLPTVERRLARRASSTTAPSRLRGRRCQILVVDDSADTADSLALLMKEEGHEVRTAYDGPAALELLQVFHPEVIFLDIGLPGMDGYEVARRIRAQPQARQPLLVAVTGYGREEDRRRAREVGFDAHLAKPADPDALNQLLADGNSRM
jgi:PAS domain S-box-containing protein